MAPPRGKGIYARAPVLYPGRDPAYYAAAMGCQFVAFLHNKTTDNEIRQAANNGMHAFLWSGPEHWLPSNWRRSLGEQYDRCARLGIAGFIADAECVNTGRVCTEEWKGKPKERQALAESLAIAAQSLPSVGFTSFPSWYIDSIAPLAAPLGVWGSPQLYGVHTVGRPAEIKARAAKWRRLFPGAVVPSLAAWNRSPEEQANYLSYFRDELGAIFWQVPTRSGIIKPEMGSPGFEVLRRWNVDTLGPTTASPLVAAAGDTPGRVLMRSIMRPFPPFRRV